jgi:RNA polymerase sigma-70 factor (ECF subfamily)
VTDKTKSAAVQARVQELLDEGDARAAATEALRELGPEILRFLRSVLRDEEDAADAFSQFAEHLWKGLPSFRRQSSLRTWAFRIAWNAALTLRSDAWHRKGRRFQTGEASQLAEELRTKTVVRVERQRGALDRIRANLTPDEQSLLALRLDREFSWEEIADILSASGERVQPLTLMKRFERLKKRLAEIVQQHEEEDGAQP